MLLPRAPLSIVLALQMAFAPLAFAQQQTPPTPAVSRDDAAKMILASVPGGQALLDLPSGSIHFSNLSGHESIVDANPYFLAGQKWFTKSANEDVDTRIQTSTTSTTLQMHSSKRALSLDVALKPFVEADDYIFLQGSEEMFRTKAGDTASYGEGIFFIDKRDLRQESLRESGDEHGVPVFFIPTEGRGWTNRIESIQTADGSSVLAFGNSEGHTLSFTLEALDQLSQLLHANLTLVVATEAYYRPGEVREHVQASLADKANRLGQVNLPYILPPRGSTAMFGTIVTGLNLDDPSHSLNEVAQNWRWFDLIIPRVYADGFLTPDVAHKLFIVAGTVFSSAVIGSLAAEFTPLKSLVQKRRAIIEEREDAEAAALEAKIESGEVKGPAPARPDRSSREYRVRTKVGDHLAVFTHTLTTVGTGAKVTLSYLMEYTFDRFGGYPGRSANGLMRLLLSKTVLNDRRAADKVASNGKTLGLGTGVLGSIDTACVVVQMLVVNQYFFPAVASLVGTAMYTKMSHMFGGHDASTMILVTAEIFRNIAGYMLNGAYSFALEQKEIFTAMFRPKIIAAMQSENKDPSHSTENQKELDKRLKEAADRQAVANGLPSSKEYLFGAQQIFHRFTSWFGYTAEAAKKNSPDETKEMSFPLEEARYGVASKVLDRAVVAARQLLKYKTDDEMRDAIAILEEVRQEFHLLRNLVRNPLNPAETIKKAVRVRQMMTTLGYGDGSTLFGPTVKLLGEWKSAAEKPEAALLSAKIYREALFAELETKEYYAKLSPAQISKNFTEAYAEARARTISNADVPIFADQGNLNLLALEIIKDKIRQENKKEKEESWEPSKTSSFDFGFEKRALARIEASASVTTEHFIIENPEKTLAEIETAYRDNYRQQYLKEVGLHVKPVGESELVRVSMAETNLAMEADQTNQGILKYVSQLEETQQKNFWARRHAETFVSKYVENTNNNYTYVPLTSPEQPGFLQRIRIKNAVPGDYKKDQKPSLAQRGRRAAEALWANNSYDLTFKSWRYRNLPLSQDLKTGFMTKLQGVVSAFTAVYTMNYYVWQSKFLFPQYVFFYTNLVLLNAAHNWLVRTQTNAGFPPMADIRSKVIFAVLWTWVTYPLYTPFFFWVNDFVGVFNQALASPAAPPVAAAAACGAVLSAIGYEPAKNWLAERRKAAKEKAKSVVPAGAEPAF